MNKLLSISPVTQAANAHWRPRYVSAEMPQLREDANKSNTFSADHRTSKCAKGSAVKCRDLFKLPDKADGRSRDRPSGFSERPNLGVNNFRRTTSMSVIVALIFILSENQRRMRLVRSFLRTKQPLFNLRTNQLNTIQFNNMTKLLLIASPESFWINSE